MPAFIERLGGSVLAGVGCCLSLVILGPEAAVGAQDGVRVFIGTYTGGRSKGIYRCTLNPATGALGALELAAQTPSPTFLALHPSRPFLYAVNEIDQYQGKKAGALSAFSVNPATGELTLLNQVSSEGSGPCHLEVDRRGRHVLAANYGGGSVAVFPVRENGGLGEAVSVVRHTGASVHPQRQTAPHAHGIYLDRPNRHALVPDLGTDKVMVYRFAEATGVLSAQDPPGAALPPGAGPRHLAFHPDEPWVYVLNELDCTLVPFRYRPRRGTLEPLPAISALPDGESLRPNYTTAEVAAHPSGKFLYASIRGHDSIAVFSIDPSSGQPKLVEHESTRGKSPRHFAIDPAGKFLLAANQGSDSIGVFRIVPASGTLEPTGHALEVPVPVCLVFFQP